MVRRRTQAVLLLTLIVILTGSALVSASAEEARYQAGNQLGVAGVALVGGHPALPDTARQASTPPPAQPSATQEPLLTEVLPPVVSQAVPTGRGLFDEITDRLLRALLNFF